MATLYVGGHLEQTMHMYNYRGRSLGTIEQHYPDDTVWGPMHWLHATSTG